MNLIEIWKRVEDWPYEVSSLGNVRRIGATKNHVLVASDTAMNRPQRHLYYCVRLSKPGCAKKFWVHRLVAEAFLGPCPIGHEVNHKDHIKKNNCIDNLEYITHLANVQHGLRHKKLAI